MIWALAGIAFLFVGLFIAPLHLNIQASDRDAPLLQITLMGFTVFKTMIGGPEADDKAGDRPAKGINWRKKLGLTRRFRPLLGPIFEAPGRRFLLRSLSSCSLSARNMLLEFGFADPALTGQVFGLVGAVSPLLGEEVSIVPDFEGEAMHMSGTLVARSNLALHCWPSLRFVFEPKVLSALWKVITWRKPKGALL